MATKTHFELYTDEGGKWRWRLQARNGRLVASSGEAFDTQFNARRAIRDMATMTREASFPDLIVMTLGPSDDEGSS